MKMTEIRAAGEVATSVQANTLMLVTTYPDTDPDTKVITVANFANSFNTLGSNGIPLMTNATPANSSISVVQSTIFHDNSYIYVATADNTLKRAALTAF